MATSTDPTPRTVHVEGNEVHYLEAGAGADCVLFLHGAAFRATTWKDLGSLELVASRGYRAVAVDLPGFGDTPANDLDPAAFLLGFLDAAGIEKPIVVSPSMSGRFSLPLVAGHADALAGFVPVAPVGIDRFGPELGGAELPALVLWGDRDHLIPPADAERLAGFLPRAEAALIADADHACYLDQPERFHELLLGFAERTFPPR